MNVKLPSPENDISLLLRAIDQPARLRILLGIGHVEACVCHLEALLDLRQAYISQHLMTLRKAGILTNRREGRYIYYRLRDPRLLELIEIAGAIAGVGKEELQTLTSTNPLPHCECLECVDEAQPDQVPESNH